MIEYKNAKEIFKEKGYEWVKGWVAELDKRNIKERTEREIEAKRLVESWELVESHKTIQYSALDNAKQHVLTLAHMEEFEKMYTLKKAIADVESCQ